MALIKEFRISHQAYNPTTDYSSALQSHYAYRRLIKRSIDSRGRKVVFVLKYECSTSEFEGPISEPIPLKRVDVNNKVHIIGAGPAGYFAALQAISMGIKPIIFERGKPVRERRRDLAQLVKNHVVNPESNYCFGEGGAGTYSDGKLYTRSKKRGDVKAVLATLVQYGADADILIDAHPHIGTNKLPQIIENLRETILEHGGEIHFESKLTDFTLEGDKLTSITINGTDKIATDNVVLATGHSAEDIFHLLDDKKVDIAFKPFALGFRIEHPQTWVDNIQYHGIKNEVLPPAAYSLVTQTEQKGVFSFCMCPGGIIAPCATGDRQVVTNGWSPSKRNNEYANSGFVAEIGEKDIDPKHGALGGLFLQRAIEEKAWTMAGQSQKAPAQMAIDFVNNTVGELEDCSYLPGVVACNLNELFPKIISKALRDALIAFDKKMPGYIKNGMIIAPETRTSSPVQILRDPKLLHSTSVSNLYPCAEGAGYAGGIISAAIDGMRCVKALSQSHVTE
jgi:uncharacterized FAD-dependent dehydrogenase